MYRASIELAKISKMKVKFNLVIKNDELMKTMPYSKLINVFTYRDSEYMKINPRPYIVLDISDASDRTDTWNSNMQVNLNKISLFQFIEALTNIVDAFSIKDIFYMQNNRLQVNKNISRKYIQYIRTSNKAIKLEPVIVYDSDNKEIEYEGICFMINSVDNFCTLTYLEAKYLLHELKEVNMTELSMSVINTYLLNRLSNIKAEELKFNKVIEEEKQQEPETKSTIPIEEPHEIPETI